MVGTASRLASTMAETSAVQFSSALDGEVADKWQGHSSYRQSSPSVGLDVLSLQVFLGYVVIECVTL